jgi:ATP-dependent DNA helicase PIF1
MASIHTPELLAPAFDDTKDNRQPDLYTAEYLASLPLHNVPPALLSMKISARYMIIKNYNPDVGVCNGTLCELIQCTRNLAHVRETIVASPSIHHCIRNIITNQVRLTTGKSAGRVVALPRLSCHVSSENSGLPFDFTRVQFPLIPAYCVSVHKSQGQSLDKVGVVADQESFAHGQLYTAFSRTCGWDKIMVMMPSDDIFVQNLVYSHFL